MIVSVYLVSTFTLSKLARLVCRTHLLYWRRFADAFKDWFEDRRRAAAWRSAARQAAAAGGSTG